MKGAVAMGTDISMNRVVGNSWFAAILAVLELILGFVMLSFPMLLGTAAVWVTGIALVIIGLVHLWHVFTLRGQRMWSLLSGIVYIIVGAAMVLLPLASLSVITMVLGVCLLFGGLTRLMLAISMRKEQGSTWRFFNAIVSIILGLMVVWSWPESSLWLVGTIIAVEMIFSGWSLLFISLVPKDKQN
ncbi:MAG: DUF308 domain-containing protein [Akkermansia sp.]|nr:DUF308 domain-containing protein [Akkermansia sp.]MBQ4636967.1 DUF308 domain-containing protein [Akkermansia sp.]MBQ9095918.1 DUF308 domain-containing protein [Akkermansia sp.]